MASGYALARGEPAFVNLHTAAGLGNAINAIANARDCRAPLVIVVGQQDRRQIAFEPFLTGRALERLAGEYPVWRQLPGRAQDVPGAIARAYHEAMAARGPALVVVPMGDWLEPADELAAGAPARILRPQSVAAAQVARAGRSARRLPSRRRWWSGAPEARGLGRRGRAGRAARLPGLAGAVQPPRRLPAGSPPVRRPPALAAPADARHAGPLRRRADRRHERVPRLPVRRAGRAGRARDARARC